MTNKELVNLAKEIDNLAFQLDISLCSILADLEKLNNKSKTLFEETNTYLNDDKFRNEFIDKYYL